MLMYFNFIISILFMMMSLAFMTLMERKMLGSLHFRLGPDKVGLFGLFQPFSDAIKLFSKDFFSLKFYQYLMWNISPSILIFILISIIFNMPLKNNMYISNNSLMLILLLISMSVFPFLISGIMSFSKYSIMGSYRCVVQMISYEIMISFVFIFLMVLLKSFNFFFISTVFSSYSGLMKFNFIFLFILFLFEMGRTPFDFIEGESELVSGFNTEFWGSYFSMFFIYEYGMLVILTSFISMMVFKFFSLIFFLVLFLMVLIRATFPRYRYDLMVNFMWKHMFFFFTFLLISSFIM